jgi:hypothetical protein
VALVASSQVASAAAKGPRQVVIGRAEAGALVPLGVVTVLADPTAR